MKRLTTILAALLLSFTSLALWAETIDVNSASAPELAAYLQGVGPAKAEAIVRYREEHGPFRDLMDLTKVPGIGPKIVENNRNMILIGSGPAGAAGEAVEAVADVENPASAGSMEEAMEVVAEETAPSQ